MTAFLRPLWDRIPFKHMTVLVIALFIIKEQFPFSNFPMYSNFDSEADVLFIADQTGNPVSMDRVFGKGSSTIKKAWKKEVSKLVNPRGRDSKQSTPEERAKAGAVVLGDWCARIKSANLPKGTSAMRLYRRTFELKDGKLGDAKPELLAEKTL